MSRPVFDLAQYVAASPYYEIARLPSPFEVGITTAIAIYRKRSDGAVDVINVGAKSGGGLRVVRGLATVPDPARPLDLQVQFPGAPPAQYLIEAFGVRYEWAMVGGLSRRYLWILSRRPDLPADQLQQLIEIASKLGYPVQQLITWAQPKKGPIDVPPQ